MWRFRSMAVFGVLVGALIFGAAVAYGSWWWNAQIDVEGVDVRTVWSVTDDPEGAENYHAYIGVALPHNSKAEVIEHTKNETVRLHWTDELQCTSEGIQAKVAYFVVPLKGAVGHTVGVRVLSISKSGTNRDPRRLLL